MKAFLITCVSCLWSVFLAAQGWTPEQLNKANTAAAVDYLGQEEKSLILYINLCRMYPAQFAVNEVMPYKGIPNVRDRGMASYKTGLLRDLKKRVACEPLVFDEALYDDAHCYANELSTHQRQAHQRVDCEESNNAECLFFGSDVGKYIALEWLIDTGVPTLGHRRNCLNPAYRRVGVSFANHFIFQHCAVGEFNE